MKLRIAVASSAAVEGCRNSSDRGQGTVSVVVTAAPGQSPTKPGSVEPIMKTGPGQGVKSALCAAIR